MSTNACKALGHSHRALAHCYSSHVDIDDQTQQVPMTKGPVMLQSLITQETCRLHLHGSSCSRESLLPEKKDGDRDGWNMNSCKQQAIASIGCHQLEQLLISTEGIFYRDRNKFSFTPRLKLLVLKAGGPDGNDMGMAGYFSNIHASGMPIHALVHTSVGLNPELAIVGSLHHVDGSSLSIAVVAAMTQCHVWLMPDCLSKSKQPQTWT